MNNGHHTVSIPLPLPSGRYRLEIIPTDEDATHLYPTFGFERNLHIDENGTVLVEEVDDPVIMTETKRKELIDDYLTKLGMDEPTFRQLWKERRAPDSFEAMFLAATLQLYKE